MGSSYGKLFKTTTWGESHGKALGAVIDGCPPGIAVSEEYLNSWLRRRKPGKSVYATGRREDDKPEILSGVFEGVTTGTPISVMVRNKEARSADYDKLKNVYRPSHADFTYDAKYGFRDYKGGGRSSGRETVGRVIAGAVAARVLSEMGITITAYVSSIGDVEINRENFNINELYANPLCMPDKEAASSAAELLDKLIAEGDSAGGIIECVVEGISAGLGEPVFDKLDAEIAKAVMSIGGVKGVEFGAGFGASHLRGSQNNDCFISENGKIGKKTNNAGGVLGGISDGSPLFFRASVKPTPSISKPQQTVDANGRNVEIEISGRHDPVIAPRAVVVIEAMTAIAVVDMLLIQKSREEWLR